MSDQYESHEDEGDDQLAPSDLRKQLKTKNNELRTAQGRVSELEQELSSFKARDVLSERGVTDPRAAAFMKNAGVDLSDSQAMETWLNENGDLFGHSGGQGEAHPEERENLEKMSQTEQGGMPSSNDFSAQIRNTSSAEELTELLQQHGNVKVPNLGAG